MSGTNDPTARAADRPEFTREDLYNMHNACMNTANAAFDREGPYADGFRKLARKVCDMLDFDVIEARREPLPPRDAGAADDDAREAREEVSHEPSVQAAKVDAPAAPTIHVSGMNSQMHVYVIGPVTMPNVPQGEPQQGEPQGEPTGITEEAIRRIHERVWGSPVAPQEKAGACPRPITVDEAMDVIREAILGKLLKAPTHTGCPAYGKDINKCLRCYWLNAHENINEISDGFR